MDYQRMRLEVIPIHVMALIAFIAGIIMAANWPAVHTFGLIAMTSAFACVVFLNIFIITLERIDERRRGVTK